MIVVPKYARYMVFIAILIGGGVSLQAVTLKDLIKEKKVVIDPGVFRQVVSFGQLSFSKLEL